MVGFEEGVKAFEAGQNDTLASDTQLIGGWGNEVSPHAGKGLVGFSEGWGSIWQLFSD